MPTVDTHECWIPTRTCWVPDEPSVSKRAVWLHSIQNIGISYLPRGKCWARL